MVKGHFGNMTSFLGYFGNMCSNFVHFHVIPQDYREISTTRYEAEIDPRRYVNTKVDFKTRKEKMYRDQFKPVIRESNPIKITRSYLHLDCEYIIEKL